MSSDSTVVVRRQEGWQLFDSPVRMIEAHRLEEVRPALAKAERLASEGKHLFGFIAYEAAPAFESANVTHTLPDLPLLCFAVFETGYTCDKLATLRERGGFGPYHPPELKGVYAPEDREHYRASSRRIHRYLQDGDSYQVNYTIRMHGELLGKGIDLFERMCGAQGSARGLYMRFGHVELISASPELFIERRGDMLRSRPMKGTRPRGMTLQEDRARAEALARSEKDRSENVMIVDMIRNDLGRVCEPGSVRVSELYAIERYPTVYQMTSEVRGRSCAGLVEVMDALFPCASITGAPKTRTMAIIRELETEPRGIYTGAIGELRPGGDYSFSVGIRTAVLRRDGALSYGVGSGVVWDSEADAEYDECLDKAGVLTRELPEFQILETMLWTPEEGFHLLDRHLQRMLDSAEYFAYPAERLRLREAFDSFAHSLGAGPSERLRVRALLDAEGKLSFESHGTAAGAAAVRAVLDAVPIDLRDPFVFHKTTHRRVYHEARSRHPDYDEVLLSNERGELTEFTTGNLVLDSDGTQLTPPVACGLLAGTYRDELISNGDLVEAVLRPQDLEGAEVYLINSVRGRVPVDIQVGDQKAHGVSS